jgi:F-type H+-transporting ATPase subunit b
MEIFPNWTAIPVVFILIVLTFVLNRTFFRPLQRILDERHRRIEGARLEADEIRRASQMRLQEFEQKMREARREADQQMASIRNAALSEKNQLITQKRVEAEAMLKSAKVEIQKKTAEARKQLESLGEEFAYEIASQILKRPLGGRTRSSAQS